MFTTITDFTADKFTPTTWEDAKKKAHFAKTFIRFVEADFPRRQFAKAFYRRLYQTFAKGRADNPAVEWSGMTFGEEWSWGFTDGFDWMTQRLDDPEYLAGYRLGELLAQEILPAPQSYQEPRQTETT